MNAKTIQLAVGHMQVLNFHSPVCENISVGFAEMDLMSVSKSHLLYEFEIKISKSDFKADFKKFKHLNMLNNITHKIPNYFAFVCPDGVIPIEDVPKYAGLWYYKDNALKEIIKAPRLHSNKCDIKRIMEKVCRLQSERHFLGCARLTFQKKIRIIQ